MYKETVEKAPKLDMEKKNNDNMKTIKSLKRDDWFYIDKGGKALAFKFVELKGNKIIGINPIGNSKTTIDISFEVGKIELEV